MSNIKAKYIVNSKRKFKAKCFFINSGLKQTGVSLVSLIIGVGLSSFLILVLLQVFASSRSNYSVAENIVEMDDAMNFIVSIMTDIIPYAGYRSPPTGADPFPAMNSAFPDKYSNVPNAYAGRYVMPFTSPVGKDGQPRDGFTIAYQGNSDGSINDCHGTDVLTNEIAYLTFQQAPGAGADNNMLCQRYGANKSTEIIYHVLDQFWVRYGEDTNYDGQIDRYLTADQNPDYSRVRSLQLAILLHSPKEVFANNTEFKFAKWGEVLTRNTKYMYKFMTFTFPLVHIPDPTTKSAQGGDFVTDSDAAIATLPFNMKPSANHFGATRIFSGNSVEHSGNDQNWQRHVNISPFVDVNALNANREIYVEYNVVDRNDGQYSYFCYFFKDIGSYNFGDGDAAKFCFKNNTPSGQWSTFACTGQQNISASDNSLNDGDRIGMSIKFPATVASGQNVITKLYKNGNKIYEFSSNSSAPCQAKWNTAMTNREKVVFTVGHFRLPDGMTKISITKPPTRPSGAASDLYTLDLYPIP